jgi:tyrosyl-tRNA synthetase
MTKQAPALDRLLTNTAEIITADEFKQRLRGGGKLTHYIGFEISGYVHIGQGIMSALVMKDLTELGVKCTVWLADWHTWINDKLDGTKETAANIGTGYFTEAMAACFTAVGGDPAKLDFRLASSSYDQNAMKYWDTVMQVLKHTSQSRLQRSVSIMGRKEGAEVDAAKLVYPAMQVADILFQQIDIAHAGLDQRKAHVVMRDVADKIVPDRPKPIALHHPLIDSLKGSGEEHKMSKSDPDSAIFIHDSAAEIERKLKKAFCPEKETKNNPVLNWTKHILFWNRTTPFVIERKPEHGGRVEFETFKNLEKAFEQGEVHPMDLKTAVAQELIALLQPVRKHFAQPDIKRKKEELDKILQSK